MRLFNCFKVYQASEFNGVLTNAGEPLSGVMPEKKMDENGKFYSLGTGFNVTSDLL